AERTADLGDVARRTLARLAGTPWGRIPAVLPEAAVLVADDLSPSELAAVPAGRLAGLCTARGGATSHVAIVAAGLGVPAVVALGDDALRVPDGAPIIVDGDRGQVRVFPAAAAREAVERTIAARTTRRRAQLAAALARRPLVSRTLAAGGDKPLPYLPQAAEDNPALGVRGVRLALRHPSLFRSQLRAILRVAPTGACRIMVPMITSLAELRAV